MDKYSKLNEVLKGALIPGKARVLFVCTITEITGDTCTVDVGGLVLTGVRLKVEIGGTANNLLVIPVVGSSVLVGSLTGDMKDLIVLKCERVKSLTLVEGDLKVDIDAETNKIGITNGVVNLKGLFQELTDLIRGLKVFTPAGPSGLPLPGSIAALNAFETNFKKLLK